MCERDLNPIATAVRHATAGTGTNVVTIPPAPNGSRRRRLWELDSHAHCPVVGVCMPIAALPPWR